MKRLLLFLFTLFSIQAFGQSPALEMLIFPKYIEGANYDDDNRNGLSYVYRAKITGLKNNKTYRYQNKLIVATTSSAQAASYMYILPPANVPAGTPNYTAGDFYRPANNGEYTNGSVGDLSADYGEFTTDDHGSYTGWFIQESVMQKPAGSTTLMRISLNDPDADVTNLSKIVIQLHSPEDQRVTFIAMDAYDNFPGSMASGTVIRSTPATSGIPKNFVFLYDNEAGTGRPISGTVIENDGAVAPKAKMFGNNGYGPFYVEHVDGVNGAWGTLILNSDATGIRRIEQRSLADGSIVGYNTSTDGSWANGAEGATQNSTVATTFVNLGAGSNPNLGIVLDGSKVTLGAVKTPQTVSFTNTFPANYKVGDPDFTLTAESSAGLSAFQYTVAPAGVLEITGNTVKIIGGGPAVITVTEPGNATIAAGTATQEVIVDAVSQTITGLPLTLTSVYGDANIALTATGGASGNAIVYTSDDSAIAEIVNENQVLIKKSGNVVIRANQAGNANYAAAPEMTTTLNIAKAVLDVVANDQTKVRGAANPEATFSYGTFKNTDDATVITGRPVLSINADAGSAAGVYDINVDVSGLSSDKYTFNAVKGKLTVENKLEQVITFSGFPAAAVYGAEPLAFKVSNTSANPFVFSSSNPAVAIAEKNAIGEWTVKVIAAGEADITAVQAGDSGYIPGTAMQHISIAKAPLKVIAEDKAKLTADADPVFTVRYEGFVNNDDAEKLGGNLQFAKQTDGTGFLIVPSGLTSNNYTLSFISGKLTLGSIAFAPMNKTYGDADFDPAARSTTGETPVYSVADAAVAVVNASGLIGIKGAGTTAVTVTFASGGTETAVLNVSKKEVLVTPNPQSKVYATANPTLTVSYAGLAYGETESVFSSPAQPSTTALLNSPVANYAITASGAAANNYSFRYLTGVLSVTQAALTFTYNDLPSVSYGDADLVPVTSAAYGALPVFSSDNTAVAVIENGMVKIKGAGTANIRVSFATTTDYTGGTAVKTLTVSKRTLIVRADSKSRVYGLANPVLTGVYDGFVNNETIAAISAPAVYTTTATPFSAAGTYAIVGAGGSAQNYSFTYEAGTLTINKAVLTVTADNKSRAYGAENPVFTFKYTGFANGEDALVLDNPALANTEATRTSPIATYPIVPSGASDENYTFNYVNGILTVNTTSRTIVFDALPLKFTTDADFSGTAVLSSGETPVFTTADPTVATIVDNKIHIVGPGTVLITATAPENANYSAKPFYSQYMVVRKAEQVITFERIPDLNTDGKTYTLKATSTSGLPVSFTVSDPSYLSLNGDVIKGLRIGKIQVSAVQAGNSLYAPAITVINDVQIVDVAGDKVKVHPALSINGDGQNEFLAIDGIKDFPLNKVTIIDRNGLKVFQIEGYDNDQKVFLGKNKSGVPLPQGTYFCLIEYNVDSHVKSKTGYFILKY